MSVLVGRQAPDFTAAAVMGNGSIKENFKLSGTKGVADYLSKHAAAL